MTDLVPYASPKPSEFVAEWLLDPAEIAQRIGGTDFVPQGLRDNPAAITAALLYGQEVGLGRMQSLAKIAVINGRPTLAAEAQRALILSAGHELWFDEATVSRCVACGRRRGSDMVSRVTWTIDDAKRAGLAGRNPWKLYPRQMLVARASAELARAVFPDVIGGLAATEELEDDPELAQVANGTAAPAAEEKPKQTRRRRVGIQAGEASTPPAEPEPESPPTPEEPKPEPVKPVDEPLATEAYKRRIFAGMRDLELTDRDERLAYTSRVIGRSVGSSNELTLGEASSLIDQLEADKNARAAGEKAFLDELRATLDATDVDEPPQGIEEAAWNRLQELFAEREVGGAADQLAYVRGVLPRWKGESLSALTADEASAVIAHLEQYDRDDPQTWPFPDGF